MEVVGEGAAKLSRGWLAHCPAAAFNEYGSVALRELVDKGGAARHLLWQTQQLRKLQTVNNKGCAARARLTTDQKAVTPVSSHRRKVECCQERVTTILWYMLLPKIDRTLDVAPLIRPLPASLSRSALGLSGADFIQHRLAP